MRIRWARRAVGHLAAIAAFVGERNPVAAGELEARLREAIRLLTLFPEMGRPGRLAGTRELVVPGTAYIIPYRVNGQDIHILAVFHAAQNRSLP